MTEGIDQSPLARTLASITPEDDELVPEVLPAFSDSYWSLATLPEDVEAVGQLLHRLPVVWQSNDPRFAAAWLFEKTLAHTLTGFVGCFALHQRVPLARAEDTLVVFDGDAACCRSGFTDSRFACLPEDPEADHQHACVLNTEAALVHLLLEHLHDVYLPLARVLAKPARRGLCTQLRVVADLAISTAWITAGAARGESEGIRLASLLGQGQSPLWGRHGLRNFPHRGRTFTHRVRTTCCLFYTCGERRYCFTCPLRSKADRQQRWARYFDAKIEEERP